jgi:hypothetical protein
MEAINNNIQSMSSMSFQKIVIIIAIILLIITLTVIGYMMNSAVSTNKIGKIAKCPDKWTYKDDDKCHAASTCNNVPYAASCNVGRVLTNTHSSNTHTNNIYGIQTNLPAVYHTAQQAVDSTYWVQATDTNVAADSTITKGNYYLLANVPQKDGNNIGWYDSPSSYTPKYTPGSFKENQEWAQTYGITWDGLN